MAKTSGRAWPPPRGPVIPGGSWEFSLRDRPIESPPMRPVEARAVGNYRALIREFQSRRAVDDLTVRRLAETSSLSTAVTNAALTGSSWPRWPSLEALAGALGANLRIQNHLDLEVIPALQVLDEAHLARERRDYHHPRSPGRGQARSIGVRPNTIYDLKKPGRAPSSANVLAVVATHGLRVVVVDQPRH